jgi:hypothetical protein
MRRSLSCLVAVFLLAVGLAFAPTESAAASSPTLAAAGDIACAPGSPPMGNACQQNGTAALVQSLNPTAVAALGDEQYESGTTFEFAGAFQPSWGAFKPLIHPVVGNHEYVTSGAAGYFGYFGPAAGQPGQGYYSYDLGTWHLIALNSNCEFVSCDAGSPQEQWLRADLASHPTNCTLAYWHHPLFTSRGTQGDPDTLATRAFWQALYDNRADIVLAGHHHFYERFAPQNPNGQGDPGGIREFIVGTGGYNLQSFSTTAPNSEVRNSSSFGVLLLTLNPNSYDWRFVPEGSGGFTDQGSGPCVGGRVIPGINGPKRSTHTTAHAKGKKRGSRVTLLVHGKVKVAGGSVIPRRGRATQSSFPLHLCGGKVGIKVKFGRRKVVARRLAPVRASDCRWRKRLVFSLRKLPAPLRSKGVPAPLKVKDRFRGNQYLRSSRAHPIRLRVR